MGKRFYVNGTSLFFRRWLCRYTYTYIHEHLLYVYYMSLTTRIIWVIFFSVQYTYIIRLSVHVYFLDNDVRLIYVAFGELLNVDWMYFTDMLKLRWKCVLCIRLFFIRYIYGYKSLNINTYIKEFNRRFIQRFHRVFIIGVYAYTY